MIFLINYIFCWKAGSLKGMDWLYKRKPNKFKNFGFRTKAGKNCPNRGFIYRGKSYREAFMISGNKFTVSYLLLRGSKYLRFLFLKIYNMTCSMNLTIKDSIFITLYCDPINTRYRVCKMNISIKVS